MIECRAHQRIPVELQVFFSATENPRTVEGTMFDISVGGCAVASTVSMHTGTALRLSIRATHLGSPITVETAAVRWSRHGEFGVEFLTLTDVDRHRLHRLLHVAGSGLAAH